MKTVSASREKKARTGSTYVQKRNNKEQDTQQRKHLLYGVVGGVLAVLVAALLIWDSGFFQKNTTAVTIDGEAFTPAVVQYYYNSAMQTELSMVQYGMSSFDYTQSPKKQIKDEKTGQTYHDYFIDEAIEALTQTTMLNHTAQEESYVLSEEGQEYLQTQLSQLDVAWRVSGTYSNLTGYLRANYGKYMTEDIFKDIVNREITASYFQQDHQDSLTYTASDLDTYCQEHKNELDTFTYSVFTVQATVPTQTDEEGNTVELSEEEQTAALETAKTEAKALAEEIQTKLLSGTDAQTLATEYEEQLYSSNVNVTNVGSSVSSSYSEWLYDENRTPGEVSIQEYDNTSSYLYYVVQFENRYLDESPTADVRHILIGAGSDPTEEEFAAAEEKAQGILDQFLADGGTEEDFATLAEENSEDSGSASNGGLYTGVSTSTGFIEAFTQWCLDPARQPGDTGLVKNEGSSTKGWHIMYFVGWNEPVWKQTATSALQSSDMTVWLENLTTDVQVERGSGLDTI